MLRRLAILIVLLLSPPLPALAGWFELSVGQDAVQASGGRHHGSDPQGRLALGLRGLYDDEHDTKLGGLVLRLEAEAARAPGLDFGIGVDVLAGRGEDQDVGAGAIAAQAAFEPGPWGGVFLGVRVAYAPSLLSWSDTESLLEWSVRGGYRITPKVELFAEYRRLEVDFADLGRRDLTGAASLGFGGRF